MAGLYLIGLLSLVSASPVLQNRNIFQCQPEPFAQPDPWFVCNTQGTPSGLTTLTTSPAANKDWYDCFHLCLNDLRCASFSFDDDAKTCTNFAEDVSKGFTKSQTSARYWNFRGCFDIENCEGSTSSADSAAATSSGVASSAGASSDSTGTSSDGTSPGASSGTSSNNPSSYDDSSSGTSSSGSSSSENSSSGGSSDTPASYGGSTSGSSSSDSPLSYGGSTSGSDASHANPSSGGSPSPAGYPSGSTDSNATGTTPSPYGGQTLLPAVHFDHPLDSLENLAPGNATQLYYTQDGISDPAVQHLFAQLSTTLQHETVILEHSAFVSSVSCSADGIVVKFNNASAFQYASTAWSSIPEFVLVTYTAGCGDAENQRTFWLVNGVTPSQADHSILCKIEKEIAIEDMFNDVDLIWGVYHPVTNSPPGYGGSSGGNGTTAPGYGGNGGSGGSESGGSGSGGSGSGGSGSGGNGTGGSGSGGSGANAGSSCGSAPSSTISGFPAADCGSATFDSTIDNAIGFLDFSSGDFSEDVKAFAPGVSFDNEDLTYDEQSEDTNPNQRRSLSKRWSIGGFFKQAVTFVANTAVTIATAPLQVARAVVKEIPVLAKAIASASEIPPSISGTSDFKLGPENSATSPWGQAALIFTKESTKGNAKADLNIYCVDCGIKAHAYLFGQAKWNLVDGLSALNANMNANVEAGLNLGLVATAIYADTKTKQLISQAIPELGISVNKIFAAGCFVGVDAKAVLDIKAEGQALLGVTMKFPDLQAKLSLFDEKSASGSSVTGYVPTIEKRFEASGQITATANLSLCEARQRDLQQRMNFFGLKTFTLNHYEPAEPLLKGCKLLGSGDSTTTTTTTVDSSTPTDPSTDPSDPGDNNSDPSGSGNPTDDSDKPTDSSGQPTNGSGQSTDSNGSTGGSTTDPSNNGSTAGNTNDESSSPEASTGSTDGQTSDSGASTSGANGQPASGEGPEGSGVERRAPSSATTTLSSQSTTRAGSPSTTTGSATSSAGLPGTTPADDTTADGDEVRKDDPYGSTGGLSDAEDDGPVIDADTDPDNAEFLKDAGEAQDAAADAKSMDGFTYNSIIEERNVFQIFPSSDGNIYGGPIAQSSDGTGLFGTLNNVAAYDVSERTMHYYPDVMTKFGCSRIRLSDDDHIPKTADMVVFKPIDDGDSSTPTALYAVSTAGDAYVPVLCNFANGAASKLFIVNSQEGLDALSTKDLTYIVTGATVSDCTPVGLIYGSSQSSPNT
ncbi:hypothetical protein TI39_contig295g00018 [Zymoseptoria brevis]|uniref:Apple domain-containing protein n=1 Tax=Zymoseptoria brevis TaxID=1047168 RepID=A0A0F4GVA7_9PEZI|nr:hypothetical protein TI39_contig295g00018 [Zymoseptoria brevis]